jgi:hypothetical protein
MCWLIWKYNLEILLHKFLTFLLPITYTSVPLEGLSCKKNKTIAAKFILFSALETSLKLKAIFSLIETLKHV